MQDPLAKYRQGNQSQSVTTDPLAKFRPPEPVKATPTNNPNSNQDASSNNIAKQTPTIQQPTINTNHQAPLTAVSNKGGTITFGNQFNKTSSVAGSATAGLLDSLSLGLISKLMNKLQPGITQQAQQENPTAFTAGKIGGYIAPASLGAKVAKPLLKGVANPIANRLLEGALVGGGMTGIEDKVNGKSNLDTAKDVGTNMALGGALDLGLYGASKGISKLLPKKVPTIEPTVEPTPIIQQEVAITKPTLQGKFTVKNTALEQAQQEYNNAIETIQNHFMTNKLTPEEVARIKPELGIDLEQLLNNIDNATTDVRKIGDIQRLKRVANVEHTSFTQDGKPYTTKYVQGKPLAPLKPLQKPLYSSTEPLNTQGNVNIPITNLNATEGNLNPSIGATDRTKLGMDIVSSTENKGKQTPKEFINNLYTRLIDINHPLKNVGESTYIKATNSKNVGGTVDHILTQNLVDRNGNKIGESLKTIVNDIPKNEENDFMNYVLQRHNIDRARIETKQVPKVDKQGFLVKDKNGNQVFDTVVTKKSTAIDPSFTSEQSSKAVKLIEQKHPEYKALNDRLVKFINTFENEWGNKSGLISDELWQSLQDTYKNYVPTQREFSTLEQGMSKTNGKGFVNQGTPLNKAKGSDRNIINPIENIMNLVNRTVRTSRYNEVGQSLVDAIENNPQALSQYAEIIPKGEPINPNVKNIVSVLVKGEPVNVQINDKSLLDALQNINKTNVGPIETKLKQGTNIFKSLITQKNPVFAIRNIARDIPTAYINGSESNPIKFMKDLAAAGKDLATNSETAQQYHALGGGGSNFFNSNNTAKSAKELTNTSLLKKIGNGIEKFNNITESAPRLAEFKRTVNKTGDLQKGLYAASDVTTNFSRGGDITKHLDSGIPYLNAGIQGLDKLARQFVTKPIPAALKGLIGITAPTIALDMVNKNNPNYQELDNRTKDNYYLIPNGDTFIKIPKSRELGVLFGSLFERIIRANSGDKQAFKGFGNTVATNFAPANPLENNIFSPALALKSNKDFANRAIVPQGMISDNRSKYLQYDEKTSEITKNIAAEVKKLGVDLSPKQMDYLIKSYTGVIGQLGLPATTKATMTGNTLQKLVKPITTQFVADPIYSNQTINDFYDNYDKIKTLATDKNILQNIPSKKLTSEEKKKSIFTKASTDISNLNKQISKAQTNNDLEKVKELRMKIIEVANKANQSIK